MYTKHGISDSNYRAKRNGCAAEQFIETLFGIDTFTNALIDAEYNNVLCEIKSCQRWIHDSANGVGMKHGRRRGRFWISREQHDTLMRTDGYYIFVLMEDTDCLAVRFMPAADMDAYNTNGENFQVSWIHVFPELVIP